MASSSPSFNSSTWNESVVEWSTTPDPATTLSVSDVTENRSHVTASTAALAFEVEHAEQLLEALNEYQYNILIPSLILVSAVLVIGIPGNIVTIYVYRTRMRRTASRMFILAVAVCDLLNCLCTMPFEIAIITNFWTFDFPLPCKISRTFTYSLNASSALLLVGIAFDRYRKICSPTKPVFTPSRTKFICLISISIGVAAAIPGVCLYGTRSYQHPAPNTTGGYFVAQTCLIDDAYTNTAFPFLFVLSWTIVNLTIIGILVVLYSLIGRAVFVRSKLERERTRSASHASRKQFMMDLPSETSCSFDDILDRERSAKAAVLKGVSAPVQQTLSSVLKNKLSSNSTSMWSPKKRQKERASKRIRAGRTTIMLFAVTVAFICSFLPFQIIVIVRSIFPNVYHDVGSAQKSIFHFFLRSYVVNCAINPILYGFFNKDFRVKTGQVLRAVLGCSRSGYEPRSRSGSGVPHGESDS